MTGTFTPRPGAAPLPRMVLAQTALETRLLLRNGEQLLLTAVIPTVLLVLLATVPVVDVGSGSRVAFVAPGILALAVMSTAFTGQAIATGFERRYGVLKRLAASPLPRSGLLAAKALTVLAVEALQVLLVAAVAFGLGWSPRLSPTIVAATLALLLTGTAAFSGLGFLLAGTLRAEATLAAANLIYLLMLLCGGVVVPLDRFPSAIRPLLELLPISALSEGLRDALQSDALFPWAALGVLTVWAVVALSVAAATFRWE
jgi:ABC-2 type transport system permease protein